MGEPENNGTERPDHLFAGETRRGLFANEKRRNLFADEARRELFGNEARRVPFEREGKADLSTTFGRAVTGAITAFVHPVRRLMRVTHRHKPGRPPDPVL